MQQQGLKGTNLDFRYGTVKRARPSAEPTDRQLLRQARLAAEQHAARLERDRRAETTIRSLRRP